MRVIDLGRAPYLAVWEKQKCLVEAAAVAEPSVSEDVLILVEHDPVYTCGRADDGQTAQIVRVPQGSGKQGTVEVPIVSIERGGKMTFHGPGQLVGYPIFALQHHDLRQYLRDLERLLMDAIAETTGLAARPCPENLLLEPGQLQTGVWVGDKKVASIGIAVRRWISYHGFAINVSTDLNYFHAIQPCGFHGQVMTSLQSLLGPKYEGRHLFDSLKSSLINKFDLLSQRYRETYFEKSLGSSAEDSRVSNPGPAIC